MAKNAEVYMHEQLAGRLTENDEGKYIFQYDQLYLKRIDAKPVSLTLPLAETPYTSNILFPFFDGLIPEGWLLDIAITNWKVNPRDRMELLMLCCQDTIGAVSIIPENTIA